MRIRASTAIAYIAFISANALYFYAFIYTQPIASMSELRADIPYYGVFYFPANYDYLKFIHFFTAIEDGRFGIFGGNFGPQNVADVIEQNFGIAFFYVQLKRIVPLDYDLLAFIVNNICFVLSYHYAVKIISGLGWSTKYSFLFFLNPQLIFYSHVINKEPPTLLFVLLLTYLISKRRFGGFVLATAVAWVLRHQLFFFAFFLYAIYFARNFRVRLRTSYVVSAAGAALLAVMILRDNPAAYADSRFVRFLIELNAQYYVGNLLLAPVKIVQWIYEQFLSLRFVTSEGWLNLYLAKDLGVIVVLVALSNRWVRALVNVRRGGMGRERVLLSAIFAWTLMLLINPLVQQRYLFPVEILLIMLGLCIPSESVKGGGSVAGRAMGRPLGA